MIDFSENDGSLVFTVRVVPRASKTVVVGELDGSLKIRIAAPPVDGAANDEVIRSLASKFDVPRSNVEILSGHNSKTKRVRIFGATPERLHQLAGG